MKSLIQRINKLDYFIQRKGTGSPATLACKIGISERSLYDYLKLMKDMGAPISYSRGCGSYYYKETGSFHITFEESTLCVDSGAVEQKHTVAHEQEIV